MSKKHFYCWYLGFTEVPSCNEAEMTREIVRQLVDYHESQTDGVAKVTLTLAEAGITIVDVQVEQVQRKKLLFKKSTQNRVVNKIYTISYDSLVQVNQHRTAVGSGSGSAATASSSSVKYGDIVTLLTKSRRVTAPPPLESSSSKAQKKKQPVRSRSASTPPVFYLHAFRFDSEESAVKMEHFLNLFRANYFSRLKPKTNQALLRSSSSSATSTSPIWDNNIHLRNKNIKRALFFMPFNKRTVTTTRSEASSSSSTASSSSSSSSSSSTHQSSSLTSSTEQPHQQHRSQSSPTQKTRPELAGDDETEQSSHLDADELRKSSSSRLSKPNLHLHHLTPQQAILEDINREMAAKFASGQPILLPPKDYTKLDRSRGNLDEARHRRSQNPVIVGSRPGSRTNRDDDDQQSSSSSSSIDDQTNEVLKILDDVVNAESTLIESDEKQSSASSSSLSPRVKQETLVFEFKPPAQQVTTSSSQKQANKEKEEDGDGFFMSAREFISGGHRESYHFKPNPLHVIDEDDLERRALDRAHIVRKLDALLTNGGGAGGQHHGGGGGGGERFKKNVNGCRAANNNNNKEKKHHRSSKSMNNHEYHQRFSSSSEDVLTAAKSGIRNNMLQRLGTYQPQWLPNAPSSIGAVLESKKNKSQAPVMKHKSDLRQQHSASFSSLSFIASSSFSSSSNTAAIDDGGGRSENSEFILIKSSPLISPRSIEFSSPQQQQQKKKQKAIKDLSSMLNNRYSFNDVYY